MESQSETHNSFKFLIIASALTVVLWFLPFGNYLTYPIRIFVTFVHEAGHAIAAVASLGSVNHITLDWNGGGVTETVGGARLLISSAGYISTTLYGACLLLLLRRPRNARAAALATAIILLVVTVLFGGNFVVWLAGVALGISCLILALKGAPRLIYFVMSFLAVQSVLNALLDLRTLVYLSAFQPGRRTDAQNMADAAGGFVPPIVWALGWSILALAILALTLLVYYRSLNNRTRVPVPAV